MLSGLKRVAIAAALAVLSGPPLFLIAFRILPPPATPLMAIRLAEGEGLDHTWVPLSAISPQLRAAVIAAEDNRFCIHRGFDALALQDAIEDWEAGKRARGASTITMQTAKNLFLWPGRSLVRKGIEAYITLWLEFLWPKRRIAEVYLNVAEWGPGIYGAEAAARRHFRVSADRLSRRQAALMAAVLPNPRKLSPATPSPYVRARADALLRRMGQLGPLLDCVGGRP